MDKIQVQTPMCCVCRKLGTIELSRKEIRDLESGMFVQDALPGQSAVVREQLISGTHPACWDQLFGKEEQ